MNVLNRGESKRSTIKDSVPEVNIFPKNSLQITEDNHLFLNGTEVHKVIDFRVYLDPTTLRPTAQLSFEFGNFQVN